MMGSVKSFPGMSSAMEGRSQAHTDVLVAFPGKLFTLPILPRGPNYYLVVQVKFAANQHAPNF